jgi:hypothetical protein
VQQESGLGQDAQVGTGEADSVCSHTSIQILEIQPVNNSGEGLLQSDGGSLARQ